MKKVSTTEEILKSEGFDLSEPVQYVGLDRIKDAMVKHTKLHVQSALKAATKKLKTCTNPESDAFLKSFTSEEKILSAYPLENIK